MCSCSAFAGLFVMLGAELLTTVAFDELSGVAVDRTTIVTTSVALRLGWVVVVTSHVDNISTFVILDLKCHDFLLLKLEF